MSGYLLERDAPNGKEGRAVMTVNGKQIELFGLKNLKTECSFDKSDFKQVGTRINQKKVTGITYTGSFSIVYGTPYFKRMIVEYVETGRPVYFNIQVTNNDPATTIGDQVSAYYDCLIDGSQLSQLDADADIMTEDINFTFNRFRMMKEFHEPEQYGGGIV